MVKIIEKKSSAKVHTRNLQTSKGKCTSSIETEDGRWQQTLHYPAVYRPLELTVSIYVTCIHCTLAVRASSESNTSKRFRVSFRKHCSAKFAHVEVSSSAANIHRRYHKFDMYFCLREVKIGPKLKEITRELSRGPAVTSSWTRKCFSML